MHKVGEEFHLSYLNFCEIMLRPVREICSPLLKVSQSPYNPSLVKQLK